MNRHSFASSIPNHPKNCKGYTGPVYTTDQCRMCWLAAYDRAYRRLWKINARRPEPVLSIDEQFPCLHRGSRQYDIPGCGLCNGTYPVRECGNPKVGSRCVITGPDNLLNRARARGYRICEECGYRESEKDLEMLPSHFKALLDQPPTAMPQGWEDWKVTRVAYREYFHELCREKISPPNYLKGRGIVIGAGGAIYFKNAWCVANHLRRHGCTLPIQFWYLGFREMDPEMLAAANAVGIECIDATQLPGKKPRILAGWELKPFSVINSLFEEVLYLDADSLPAKNPEYLFDLPEYQERGAMFWPDLPPSGRKEWIPNDVWDQWGLLPDSGPDLESGQFLVNKSRCWHELKVTMWLNEHSDWVYKTVYGDKSTYNLAWAGCNTDYLLPRKLPIWNSPIILQHDLEGEVVFQHCCQGKQHLATGIPIRNLNNHEWALEAIADLKNHWSGQMYVQKGKLQPGKFVVTSEKPFDVSLGKMQHQTINLRRVEMQLLQGGYVLGECMGFRSWYMPSPNELFFMSRGRVVYVFRKVPGTNEWVEETYEMTGVLGD